MISHAIISTLIISTVIQNNPNVNVLWINSFSIDAHFKIRHFRASPVRFEKTVIEFKITLAFFEETFWNREDLDIGASDIEIGLDQVRCIIVFVIIISFGYGNSGQVESRRGSGVPPTRILTCVFWMSRKHEWRCIANLPKCTPYVLVWISVSWFIRFLRFRWWLGSGTVSCLQKVVVFNLKLKFYFYS